MCKTNVDGPDAKKVLAKWQWCTRGKNVENNDLGRTGLGSQNHFRKNVCQKIHKFSKFYPYKIRNLSQSLQVKLPFLKIPSQKDFHVLGYPFASKSPKRSDDTFLKNPHTQNT